MIEETLDSHPSFGHVGQGRARARQGAEALCLSYECTEEAGLGPDSLSVVDVAVLVKHNQKEFGNMPLGSTKLGVGDSSFSFTTQATFLPLWDVTQDDILSLPKL